MRKRFFVLALVFIGLALVFVGSAAAKGLLPLQSLGSMQQSLVAKGAMQERPAAAATLTVNTLSDENDGSCSDGDCSLRDAVQLAAPGDTINLGVTGAIVLTQGQILIDKELTLIGPGAANLTISGNDASRAFEAYADLNVSGVRIANGQTTELGGGIFIRYSYSVNVSDCTFSSNDAHGGGAIYNGGTLQVTRCTFADNTADFYGGGAILSDYTTTVTISTFENNVAEDTYGGAITTYGPLDVSGSTFSGNHAIKGGGIYSWDLVNVTNSTFTDNEALGLGGGLGGGIYTDDWLVVTNSTFRDNTAMYGGGIYNGDDLLLYNCTLVGNSATGTGGAGGGVYNSESGQLASNTIIAGSPVGGNCNYPGMFSQGNPINLTTDDTCGNGFTQTTVEALKMTWYGWLFGLQAGSVAIDTGSANYCPSTDQRGVTRPQDGDGNGTAVCDVGSYEVVEITNRAYLPLVMRNR